MSEPGTRPPSLEQLEGFRDRFKWSEEETSAITTFVGQWVQGDTDRKRLEATRLAVLKAHDALSKVRGPIHYLARDWKGVISLSQPGRVGLAQLSGSVALSADAPPHF